MYDMRFKRQITYNEPHDEVIVVQVYGQYIVVLK